MNMLNTSYSYGWISILLHWVSFLISGLLLGSGLYMVELTYYDPLYNLIPKWHEALGVGLAIATLLRIFWVFFNPSPQMLSSSALINGLARGMHCLLYITLLVLFVTGYFILTADGNPLLVFGTPVLPAMMTLEPDFAQWVGIAHRWAAYFLAGLVCAHGSAALQHHFIHRDATLKRMIFPQQ